MADENRVVTTEFAYSIDKASVEAVKRVNDSFAAAELRRADEAAKTGKRLNAEIDRSLRERSRLFQEQQEAARLTAEKLNNSSFRIEPQAQETISEAEQRFQALRERIDSTLERTKAFNRELRDLRVPEPSLSAFGAYDNIPEPPLSAFRGSGGRGGRTTGQSIASFGNYGSQIFNAVGLSELGQATNLLGDVAAAAGTLNPALVATTATIGAVSLAFKSTQELAEKASDALRARLAVERELNQFLIDATREQAEERIQELNDLIEFERAEITRLQGEREAYIQQSSTPDLATLLSGVGLFQFVQTNTGILNEYNSAIEQSGKNVRDYTTEQSGLIAAVNDGATAANDAAAAERILAQARLDAIDENIRRQVELRRLERSGTVDEAQTILRNYRDERDAVEVQIQSLENVNELTDEQQTKLKELRQRFDDLTESYRIVAQVLLPSITAREREAEAAEKLRKAHEELTASLEGAFDKLAGASEDVKDARRALTDAEAEGRANLDRLVQEGRDKRAEIERDVEKARTDIAVKAGEARAKAEEAAEERRNQVLERYELSRQEAVEERNTVAKNRAERQRDQELREADRSHDKQLRDIEDALRKQAIVIRDRYNEQIRTVQTAQSKALTIEYQKYQAEITLRQEALDIALHQYAEFNARLQAIVRGLNGQEPVVEGRTFPGRPAPTPYATGGYLPANTVGRMSEPRYGVELARDSQGSYVMFNKPMRILDANESRQQLGTTNNLSFTINGMGAKQVRAETRQQVIDELDSILTDLGFD